MTSVDHNIVAVAIEDAIKLQGGEKLYVIIDACQAYDLVQLARNQYKQPTRMLFKGAAACAPEIESVAPYFIPVDLESDFLEQYASYWGKNAGILFVSDAAPRVIFKHLRKIFVVQDETDQEYFFRFYDPRVLRVYLPTCTPEETTDFFGPIQDIYVDSENLVSLVTYAQTQGALNIAAKQFQVNAPAGNQVSSEGI